MAHFFHQFTDSTSREAREAHGETTAETAHPLHHHIHPTRMDTKVSRPHSLLNTLSESDPRLGDEFGWSEPAMFRATGLTYVFGAPSSPHDDGFGHQFQMDKFVYVREVRFFITLWSTYAHRGCFRLPRCPRPEVVCARGVRESGARRPFSTHKWFPGLASVGMFCVPDMSHAFFVQEIDFVAHCRVTRFVSCPTSAQLPLHRFFSRTTDQTFSIVTHTHTGFGIETPTAVDAHFARGRV